MCSCSDLVCLRLLDVYWPDIPIRAPGRANKTQKYYFGKIRRIEVTLWEQIYRGKDWRVSYRANSCWHLDMPHEHNCRLSHRARDNPFHNGIIVLEFGDTEQEALASLQIQTLYDENVS